MAGREEESLAEPESTEPKKTVVSTAEQEEESLAELEGTEPKKTVVSTAEQEEESLAELEGTEPKKTVVSTAEQAHSKNRLHSTPRSTPCPKHGEPLIIYCFVCDLLICQHCTVKDHRDHNFEFCKIAAPTTKGKLVESLEPLKVQIQTLAQAILGVRVTRQEIKAQGTDVAASIKKSFKELREILDKREQELLQEADETVGRKTAKLSEQEKKLSVASTEVQSVVDYTEQCVRDCTDNEVMIMHTKIRRQIEQKIEEHSKSGRSLEPVEEADIGVDVWCADALRQLCRTQASVFQLPVDTFIEVQFPEMAEVGKVSRCTLTVTPRLSNDKTIRRQVDVTSFLRCTHNNSTTECIVVPTGAGQYSIQYAPTVRGHHELTVLVDGHQVSGSPFPVFVSIHPTLLKKPVKVWQDFKHPTGITMNSAGDILVSELDGIIEKIDIRGCRTTLIDQKRVTNLRNIEVDNADIIYSISETTSSILRYDQSSGGSQVQELKHVKEGCWGLNIVNDEVIICGKDNGGTLVVYDKELAFRRCIKKTDGDITAISVDCHGNLYCADWANACIQVFDNDGKFLRCFGDDENGEKKVKKPWGLCVSGHYVYVCNGGFHNVSVFTTEGVYVTSFGQRGSNEGDFHRPLSIVVDHDQFVYVIDYCNDRVQCF